MDEMESQMSMQGGGNNLGMNTHNGTSGVCDYFNILYIIPYLNYYLTTNIDDAWFFPL